MPTFAINKADLDFLLEQVTIGTDYSQLTNALDPRGLREVSGGNNNLVGSSVGTPGPFVPGPYTTLGEADQDFLRLSQATYSSTGGPDAAYGTPGTGTSGNVADATPRLVSNLVSTMFTTGAYTNPAAVEAMADFYGTNTPPVLPGTNPNPDVAFMPTAGVLGGGRYNAWFVAFGQFFDHGLDFVQKGASGTISIPIPEGDPLYVVGGPNVMQVSRANLANPATDFNPDGSLMTGVDPIYKNNTGLLIDQSQTYGSHESVNALLREYSATGTPTGRIMTGNTAVLNDGDPGNDAQATGLATWADIKLNALRIGVVLTDADIHNAPVLRVDATGKLMFTPDGVGPNWTTDSIVIGPQAADDPFMRNADGTVMRTNQDMLIDFNPGISPDLHYITGDGRANENVMLTAVHHVFHEEHNFQVENIKAAILGTLDTAFIAQWQTAPGVWDGEKLFQAARLITESEYNHIAVDQYVGTLYGALPEFVSYSSDIDMSVSLEFSQAVFRLGHSMLTETFKVADSDPVTGEPTGTFSDVPLLQAFLNPTQFADLGPAAITAGMVRTYGNEVDEFVTPALQQSLLGQPLDLATINIARGRDVGLPTHNELRQQIYDGLTQSSGGNGAALAPYTSWQDYGDHLRHPGTLVNMIAAYARDGGAFDWGINEARAAYLAGTGSLDAIRVAAQAVVDAYTNGGDPLHAAAVTFMQGTPAYNPGTGQWDFTGGDQGFWDVDLWIGGLAERPLFDGPLGTTFSYVLLDFAQRQQDGDRFYYLYRTPMGTNLGNEIIGNHFTDLVQRATGLEHLTGDVFITPDAEFELGKNPDGTDANTNDFFDAAIEIITYVDGTEGPASGAHLIIAGNNGHDYLKGGLGDDTIYGDDGNDFIEGSQGNDHLYGGAGDDTIHDDENDDFIRGGTGNDRIFAGGGALDTVFGDEGDDELHGGDGIDEVLGGEGDDLIFGEGDTDVLFGGNGNDYLDGGDSVDEMWAAAGNDWLRGGVGDDHLVGGDGNDLLEGGLGPTANDGDRLVGQGAIDFGPPAPEDLGFDVASYEDVDIAITANLDTTNQNGTGPLIDTYAGVDGLVGTRLNDNLVGAGPGTTSSNGVNNLLVGGAGNDILTGLGGDDVIFGDSVVVRNDLSVYTGPAAGPLGYTTITNWKGTGEDRPDFGVNGGLGHFLGDNAAVLNPYGNADKAVFSGAHTDYTVTQNPDLTLRIVDNRGIDSTAVGDTVKDVELFQFSDGTLTLAQVVNKAPTDIQWNGVTPDNSNLPAAGAVIANLGTVDPDSVAPWTYSLRPGSSPNFTISPAGVVTRTGSAMAANTTYTLNVRSTDSLGAFRDEAFNVRTGDNNGNNLTVFATVNDDVIYGDDGNDILVGGAGNDTLFGQDEDDTLTGGLGDDVLNGGVGDSDTATYAGAVGSVDVNLATGLATGADGNDTLVSIGNIIGSGFDDTLTGDSSDNVLSGGLGNDTYRFGLSDGDDDTVNETGGTSDRITILTAGAALASLSFLDDNTGTNNGDLDISFNGQDVTVIDHFDQTSENIEVINFDNGSFAGYAFGTGDYTISAADPANSGAPSARTVAVASGNNLLAGESGASRMTGGTGNDLIFGNGGNDFLNGGGGNDLLVGGTGNDAINGDAGNDTIVVDIDGDPNDNDVISGGTETDTLSIIDSGTGNETLTASYSGGRITQIEGSGSIAADIEAVTANLGAGTDDTLDYNTSAAVTINLTTGTASGFTSISNIENVTGGTGADSITGNAAANDLSGDSGADTIFGAGGNDNIDGNDGDDFIDGGEGNDDLNGGNNNDTYVGGAGNDTIDVGNGNDLIRYTAAGFGADVIDNFDATGGTAATQDLIDVSALGLTAAMIGTTASSRIQVQNVADAGTDDTLITLRDAAGATLGTIFLQEVENAITASDFIFTTSSPPVGGATNGNDTLTGTIGNDTVAGLQGNDTVNTLAGDDTIIWNANAADPTDGMDIVNGGTEGTAGDTFVLNGRAAANETFRIYTVAAWVAAGNSAASLAAGTEIVITRDGTNLASVIAQLSEIEEIRVNGFDPAANGALGGDNIEIIGDFAGTSLRPNTITIDGDAGDDTVDISALTSAHRIVFKSNGGNDTIVGTLRPQDVIQLPAGMTAADYETTTAAGVTTMTSDDGHTVTFVSAGGSPKVVGGDVEMLAGTTGRDRLVGTGANEMIDAGAGDDRAYGGGGNDTFVAALGDGRDAYYGDAGSDTLDLSAITARATVDLGSGWGGRGSASSAQSGSDLLLGVENVVTGSGADGITASTAANVMEGGAGNDTFYFTSAAAANGDTILDFEQGDRLDLSAIDANAGARGNQAFTLVSGPIAAAGQLMVSHETRDGVDYTVVEGNTGGDNAPEFKLSLQGHHDLDGNDFKF